MKIIYVLFFIAFISNANAQIPEYLKVGSDFERKICRHTKDYNHKDQLLAEPSKKKYDAVSYKIYLDWLDILNNPGVELRQFNAENDIKLVLTEATNEINIDAQRTLLINSVSINGEEIQNYTKDTEILKVSFNKELAAGTELELNINYTFSSKDTIGFYLYEKDPTPGYLRNPETIAYTMSEPDEARFWYPCNDMPSDKALFSISAKVPAGFQFISNGLLKNTEETDEYSIFHWESNDLMATYLAVADASIFVKLTEDYSLFHSPEKSIELQYYVWAIDTISDGLFHPDKAFHAFPDMMKFFEENYGAYPFEKYAHITVAPYEFGGMEHQTATTIHRNWLTGWVTHGVVHELAHHWLGDLITCNTWQDIWINEGGATWSEALYFSQKNRYDKVLLNYRQEYIDDAQFFTPISEVKTNILFGAHYSLVYYKSGWFYHMMSEMLGRENFLAALRNIIEKYKFQSVTTEMFLSALKEFVPNPPVDWDTFFNQWITTPGHPIYRIGYKTEDLSDDSTKVYVSINQEKITEDDVDFYKMPIRFSTTDLEGNILFTTQQFMNDRKDQHFEFNAPIGFDNVIVDSMSVLYQSIPGGYNLVASDEQIDATKLYPNVISNGETATLIYNMPAASQHEISIVDLNGRKVKNVFQGVKNSNTNELKFSVARLSPGVYFIQIISEYGIESKEFFIIE